jgi:hypothetical protein
LNVACSITLFQNLFCLLVISWPNIAIFFFSPSLPSVYTASSYLGLPSALHYYAAAVIYLPLENPHYFDRSNKFDKKVISHLAVPYVRKGLYRQKGCS